MDFPITSATVWLMERVTDLQGMFNQCVNLTSIYCNDDWSMLDNITSSEDMFNGCVKLVGENGQSTMSIILTRLMPGWMVLRPPVTLGSVAKY